MSTSEKFYTVSRGYAEFEKKWDYSGTFYSVHLRVDKPVVLHRLGFLPPDKESALFFTYIDIRKPNSNERLANSWESERIAKVKVDVLAEKGKTFYVDLGGVFIEPSWNFYLIQFMLDGPETGRIDTKSMPVVVEEGGVRFDFGPINGSRQMSEIVFSPCFY